MTTRKIFTAALVLQGVLVAPAAFAQSALTRVLRLFLI